MNISFISLLILIIWLPLPYGSVHPLGYASMEIGLFSLALLWLWQYLRGQHKPTIVFLKAIPILIVWLLWLIYIIFQLTPLDYSWIQWLSPQAAQIHAFKNPTLTTLSVDPHSTAVGFLKSLSYVLLFTLTLLMVNTRSRLRWVALALVISGLIQGLYASFMTLSGLEYGFFHEKFVYLGVATGTFINRNHLAGYLVMCLSVGIGLMIALLGSRQTSYSTWRQRLAAMLAWVMSPKMILRMVLVFMVIGLVLTHSRMGNSAFFASMMIAGLIALILSRYANRATVILLVSLIVIDIFIVGTWFGLEEVQQRIQQTDIALETRDEIDVDIIPYWQDYFWTGSGLSSFYTTFPHYQGRYMNDAFWKHAHNDYLEFAAETGIIGLLLLGIAIVLTMGAVLIALYRRRRSLNRGIAFSVTMAIIALLIHSTVDFNLQIPANAATFMLILALGWVALYLPSETISPNNLQPPSHFAKSIVLSLMVALIYFIYLAGSWGLADFINRQAQFQMAQWKPKVVTLDDWTTTHKALLLADRLESNDPNILKNLGLLYSLQARLNLNQAEKMAALKQSLDYFLKSAKQRPTDYYVWSYILDLKHRLRQYDAIFLHAFENLTIFASRRSFVQHTIINVGLANWYRLPKRVQNIVIFTLEQGMKTQHKLIFGLIKKYHRKWVICAVNTQQPKLLKFCRQIYTKHNRYYRK